MKWSESFNSRLTLKTLKHNMNGKQSFFQSIKKVVLEKYECFDLVCADDLWNEIKIEIKQKIIKIWTRVDYIKSFS